MPIELQLIPPQSRLTENGNGPIFDLASSQTRTFLCSMEITAQLEQESVDLSVWGSPDGEAWESKPLLIMPQRFYKGETSQILDLSLQPHILYIRAHWKLTRWGRVAPRPFFAVGFTATEIPAFARRQT
jgi:hypothetical protein